MRSTTSIDEVVLAPRPFARRWAASHVRERGLGLPTTTVMLMPSTLGRPEEAR